MKRRFYALMLVVAMLAMTLVGCGSDTTDTTNTTNDATVNTEVEESGDDVVTEMPTEEPTTTPEVEEPVVEPTEEPETPQYAYSHTWVFPDGLEGFTKKFLNENYPEWSVNETHYVDINGNEMNFEWEGPAGLGEKANTNKKTLSLYDSAGEYVLRTFTTGELSPETYDEIKSYDKETIISFAAASTPYVPNGYYNANIGDTYMSFTYAVAGDIPEGGTYMGYEHYIMDRDKGLCYQFSYLENTDIYDDTRAMNVINSLDFWDYIPEE